MSGRFVDSDLRRVVASGTGWEEVVYGTKDDFVSNPSVSVCVTTYQHRNFIRDCLASIAGQKTSFPFEILIGEDNSTDGTREICEQFAGEHPGKVRLFLHDRSNLIRIHGKPTGRFNFYHSLTHSRGRYVALCEGDDYWTDPEKLQKQVDFLETNSGFVCCFHNAVYVDEQGTETNRCLLRKQCRHYAPEELVSIPWMPTATVCYRRDIFENLPSSFLEVFAGDAFLASWAGKFGAAGFVDVKPSSYRKHPGGVWSSADFVFRSRANLHTWKTLWHEHTPKLRRQLAYRIVNLQNELILELAANGERKEARDELAEALRFCRNELGVRCVSHQIRWALGRVRRIFTRWQQ